MIKLLDVDAVLSVSEALNGSLARLANRLRGDEALCKEERDFLANLLEGKTERPRHWQTKVRKYKIAQFLFYHRRLNPSVKWEAAVAQTMAHFKVGRSTVTQAWTDLLSDEDRLNVLEASVDALRA
jgi:hypothetical protein